MKFTYTVTALVLAAASVQATETNGQRLARGLQPLPPRRLHGSRTTAAKRTSPSGAPTGGQQCTTGPVHCCNSVGKANDNVISLILGLLGLNLDPDVNVGVTCSPLTVVGAGGGGCSAHTVCCENNSKGGLISIGCIPIFL